MNIAQPLATESPAPGIGIAAVERDTGLGKDTLRIWERRYGFPRPLRDAFGERVYPPEQVEHLRLVKRLMDQGLRPGALLRQPMAELGALVAGGGAKVGADDTADWIVPLLKARDIDPLRAELAQRLARDGLERFVIETVRQRSISLAPVTGGGYRDDVDALVRSHAALYRVASTFA